MANDNDAPEQEGSTLTRRGILSGMKWTAAACAFGKGLTFEDSPEPDNKTRGLKATLSQGERNMRAGYAMGISTSRNPHDDDFTPSF